MLSEQDRPALAKLLLASLPEDNGIARAWADEAERRAIELEEGRITAVPVAEALSKLRGLLK